MASPRATSEGRPSTREEYSTLHSLDAEYNDKFLFVCEWLRHTYALSRRKVPQWEVVPETIDVLYEIAKNNIERERDIAVIISDLQKKRSEYIAEGIRYSASLAQLDVSISSMSKSGMGCVKSLCAVASSLQQMDTSTPSFLISIGDLSIKEGELRSQLEFEQSALSAQEKCLCEAVAVLEMLQRVRNQCGKNAQTQEAALAAITKSVGYLDSKRKEYEKTIQSLRAHIESSGYHSNYSHSTLCTMHDHLVKLQAAAEEKKRKVDSYKELPPDEGRAKLRVEEARQELRALERELQKNLEDVRV